jgi:hypothetical protein
MKKKPELPKYSMSQPALVAMANEKLLYLRRDAATLAGYDVSTLRLDGLQQLTADFVALPTEDEGVQATAATTQTKLAARAAALDTMQTVMNKVKLLHHDGTPQYKAFGTSGLHSASDGDLYLGLVRCVRVGRANLATYTVKGLTAALLDQLEAQNTDLLQKVGQQHDAESKAATATQQRLKAGNALYEELTQLCEAGKSAFVQTDVVRHADYVIYDAPAPAPEAKPGSPAPGKG